MSDNENNRRDRYVGCSVELIAVCLLAFFFSAYVLRIALWLFVFVGLPVFIIVKIVGFFRERRDGGYRDDYRDEYRDDRRGDYRDEYRDERRYDYRDEYRDERRHDYRDEYRDERRGDYRDEYRDGRRGDYRGGGGSGVEEIFLAIMRLHGYVAGANPRVTPDHIRAADKVIDQFKPSPETRKLLIAAFDEGKAPGYDPRADIRTLASAYREKSHRITCVAWLVNLAMADGALSGEEKSRIEKIAFGLGLSERNLRELFREFGYRYEERREGGGSGGRGDGFSDDEAAKLAWAKEIFGYQEGMTAEELSKIHKRLLRKYHPDHLKAKGIHESMRDVYEKKSKDINEAYDVLKKKLF